jgi:hypothetical protein
VTKHGKFTRTYEAIQFDGTRESWEEIIGMNWGDCSTQWKDDDERPAIWYLGFPTYVSPGDWVACTPSLEIVPAERIEEEA